MCSTMAASLFCGKPKEIFHASPISVTVLLNTSSLTENNDDHSINAAFTDGSIVCGDSAIISTARQHAVTTGALAFIDSAISALDLGQTADMISSDIERALRTLSEADGREVSEAVTSEIFTKFCVGK